MNCCGMVKWEKDRILIKCLKDTVEFFINAKHEFDPEIVEFYSTIEYLGGRKPLNFIRGPMFYKQVRPCKY